MKRSIIVILFILSATAFSSGQTFQGGLTAGIVASQLSGDQSAGYNKLGIYGGPWANFKFRERWRLQMEIMYIQKGSRENRSEDNGYYSYKSKLNYIEVPVMFRFIYTEKLDFEAGLAYSFLISSYEELYDVEINERPFYLHNSSLIIGLYYKFNEKWCANFRTSNSITPVRKHKSGQTYWFNFGQTNNILTLGLFFRL